MNPRELIRAGPFHRHQYGAAPFAAHADTLDKAEDGENDRAPDADACVSRDQRDRKGRQSHQQERRDKGRLAPDPIAVMAEDGSPDGPRDKPHGVNAKRLQRADPRVRMREK